MHIVTSIIVSLLSLSINAAFLDLRQRSTRSPDQCGPQIQFPSDPKDTCDTAPVVSTSPEAFGIYGLPTSNASVFNYDWSNCSFAISIACNRLVSNDTANGNWVFETGLDDGVENAPKSCQIGFYLPPGPEDATTPAALRPTLEQCENILNTAVSAAENNTHWFGATINLRTNPANQTVGPSSDSYINQEAAAQNVNLTSETNFDLPGGSGTGAAVNSGYPSYVVAVDRSPWTWPIYEVLGSTDSDYQCTGRQYFQLGGTCGDIEGRMCFDYDEVLCLCETMHFDNADELAYCPGSPYYGNGVPYSGT